MVMMLVRPDFTDVIAELSVVDLPDAGRADDEDHAVLVLEEVAQLLHRRGGEAELLERRRPLR
jgi:hypothetical protein